MPRINTLYLLFFLLTFPKSSTQAQVSITGLIQDTGAHPIPFATVAINDEANETVDFTRSNTNGKFSFDNIQLKKNFKIVVSNIGYETQEIIIPQTNNLNFTITLIQKSTTLPQVIVKSKDASIRQIRDTIAYDVAAFRDGRDRVLKDVLEKLPGITVSQTGQILYQNKAINKFYIDGNDILDDRYNLATNNLPLDAIDKVQVLENHQPIKILDSVITSERAGINIKLKSNARFKLIGRVLASLGYNPNLQHNGQATVFSFKGKIKFVNTIKKNNIGLPIADEIANLNRNYDADIISSYSIKQDFVDFVPIQSPSIKKVRYNFNNDFLQSNNLLINLKKDIQLKVFTAILSASNKVQNKTKTFFYLPTDTISVSENTENKKKSENYFATFTLVKNTKKMYFNNITNIKYIKEKGTGLTESDFAINQKLAIPFFNVNNTLNTLLKSNKKYISINSFTAFTRQNQSLFVLPGVFTSIINSDLPYTKTQQDISFQSFYSNNSIGAIFTIKNIKLSSKLGLLIEQQKMNTGMAKYINETPIKLSNPFINSSNWFKIKPYFDNTATMTVKKLTISLGISLIQNIIRYDTINGLRKIKVNKLFPNKTVGVNYQLNKYFSFDASFNNTFFFNNIIDTKTGYFLENYRYLTKTANTPLLEQNNLSLSLTSNYKNVLSALFINANITLGSTKYNLLNSTSFFNQLQITEATSYDNVRKTNAANFNLSKFFSHEKISLNVSTSFQSSEYLILQQNLLRNFKSNAYTISAKVIKNYKKTLSIAYDFDANFSKNFDKNASRKAAQSTYTRINQSIKIDKTIRSTTIGFTVEHNFNNLPTKMSNFYSDINLFRRLRDDKSDIFLSLLNIFDSRYFTTNSFTDNNFVTTQYVLRPFSIVAGYKFNF